MWYKVNNLYYNDGLNKSQIALELEIDRATVRRYLSMDEPSFRSWISQEKPMPHKLMNYYEYVKNTLEAQPYLSSAQIEDRLKENYHNPPDVHPKTVYNFVRLIRKREGIKKYKTKGHRDYHKLPEENYGKEAQVDFGEYTMKDSYGTSRKVYFFTMVLSRSRYKFVYFQYEPFTSATAIYAHLLAFEYFAGIPERILYDQDRVFIREENHGDWILTDDFARFSSSHPFTPDFCRKADPETKGKIENVVGYVKYNFLRGREYTTIDVLNRDVKKWLQRTGNGKVHGTTQKVPAHEWEIEKGYLHPLVTSSRLVTDTLQMHTVRKDNVLVYRGNFYSLPEGTYTGRGSVVLVQESDSRLIIYNVHREVIARHQISYLKGEFVWNSDHWRDKSTSMREKEHQALEILGGDNLAKDYLKAIHTDKPRHYHDHLKIILDRLSSFEGYVLRRALQFCMAHSIYNSNQLTEVAEYYHRENERCQEATGKEKADMPEKAYITPNKTHIDTYEFLM